MRGALDHTLKVAFLTSKCVYTYVHSQMLRSLKDTRKQAGKHTTAHYAQTHTWSCWPLQSAERRKMEAHSLTGWVGWSAGHSGAVHLGILLKYFTHANTHIITSLFSQVHRNLVSALPPPLRAKSKSDKLKKIAVAKERGKKEKTKQEEAKMEKRSKKRPKHRRREQICESSRWSLPLEPAWVLHWCKEQNLKPMQMWSPEPWLGRPHMIKYNCKEPFPNALVVLKK